jgi:hypothetical protein
MGEMAMYFQLGELEEYIDKIVEITEEIPSSFFLVKANTQSYRKIERKQ